MTKIVRDQHALLPGILICLAREYPIALKGEMDNNDALMVFAIALPRRIDEG